MIKEKNFISIVVYLKNDENNVIEFVKKINSVIESKFETYEYIFINDFSNDGSEKSVKKLSKIMNASITFVDLPWEHGIERAMLSGIDMAIGDFVYEFESTIINYDIEILIDLYLKALEGYDIVSASPNDKKITSRIFYKFLSKFSNEKVKITTETFRLISRRAINRVFKSREKFKYRKISYHYSGLGTYVYSYKIINKLKIKNHKNLLNEINFASDVLVVFSNFGFKFSITFSFVFFFVAIITLLYTIISYMFFKHIEPGWTTTMLFLSFSFSGLFFMISIIIKYLDILIKETQAKDTYIFKKTVKINDDTE